MQAGHRVVLAPAQPQVAGVDLAALPDEVAHGARPAVGDDGLRHVRGRPSLGLQQRLEAGLVDRRAGQRHDGLGPEGDHLAQLGLVEGQPVVQAPEQVTGVADGGVLGVHRHRAAPRQTDAGASEGFDDEADGTGLGQHVARHEHDEGRLMQVTPKFTADALPDRSAST